MDNIGYELVRSNRRTVSIQVNGAGDVVVRAPMRLAKREIDKFVVEKADWIKKNVEKAREAAEHKENLQKLSKEELERLKRLARVELRNLVWEYAPLVGAGYGRITIRAQKSRWGSCTQEGNLSFNCLLMLAPPMVQRYVVVHELCHRIEMNHSKRFWKEVARVIPEYKECRAWLRKEGNDLIARLP